MFWNISFNKDGIIPRIGLKKGLYTYEGEEILPIIFDDIIYNYDDKLVECKLKKQWLYYIIDIGKFFQLECVEIQGKKGYKYFLDGKWHRHS